MKKPGFILLGVACAGIIGGLWYRSHAAAAAQKSFSTAEAAAQALVQAAQNDDTATLLLLFGPKEKEIVASGDPVRDRSRRAAFVERARQSLKVQPVSADRDRAFILVGEDEFPFPIPIVKSGGRWRFDTQEGKHELLARRIGSNELDAIDFCHRFVDAEYQFAAEDHDGSGVRQYAQRFISSPGKKDGLYWPAPEGSSVSPIADLVTEAAEEGYDTSGVKPVPYHGYVFRFLTGQGANAQGGANEYMVHGLMIGGFGLIAWPVEYGTSGIKTFLVNQSGDVFEKDLGRGTPARVLAITTFDPDPTWKVVQ